MHSSDAINMSHPAIPTSLIASGDLVPKHPKQENGHAIMTHLDRWAINLTSASPLTRVGTLDRLVPSVTGFMMDCGYRQTEQHGLASLVTLHHRVSSLETRELVG